MKNLKYWSKLTDYICRQELLSDGDPGGQNENQQADGGNFEVHIFGGPPSQGEEDAWPADLTLHCMA